MMVKVNGAGIAYPDDYIRDIFIENMEQNKRGCGIQESVFMDDHHSQKNDRAR